MKHVGQPPTIPTRQQDWIAAALSTITVATLIAVAAVGAYVTIVGGQGNFGFLADRTFLANAIVVALVATLLAYGFVVATGMNTVFTTDEHQRHRRVKIAAGGFYFQVVFVIVFTFLLTFAVFTNDSDSDRSTTTTETDAATFSSEFGSSDTITAPAKDGEERPSYNGVEWCPDPPQ